tara:strand:+ start:22 stop:150 length:129 start_codon:yes stop_codon:yes gene_type:complete
MTRIKDFTKLYDLRKAAKAPAKEEKPSIKVEVKKPVAKKKGK